MRGIRALAAATASLFAASTAFAAAPRLVRDINPTIIPVDSAPYELIDQGPWSFFQASDGVHHAEPWATDGTTAGTVSLGSITPFAYATSGNQTVRAGGFTYFFNSGGHLQPVLYRVDGTAAGTRAVKDFWEIGENAGVVGALGDHFIFSLFETARGREFWRSDGTEAGTFRITDVGGQDGYATSPVIANGKLYFLSLDFGTSTVEPWVTDGTAAGTHRLAQLPNVTAIMASIEMIRVGNYLLFTANTTTTGSELWRIDLTNDAVSLLRDIAPGAAHGITDVRFGSLGNVAVFMASATDGGTPTLWRTDGTLAGTYQASNVSPASDAPTYYEAASTHRLLFRVIVGNDVQLWSTDGSTATQLPAPGASFLGTVGGNVYFYSSPGLWRSDGTPAGTKRLTGLPTDVGNVQVAGSDTQLFVRTSNPSTAISQWRYDLATETAVLLRSHTQPLGTAYPNLFGYGQGKLYFDSVDPITGKEIYVSDGTPAGTHLLRNIAPETRTEPSDPRDLFEFDGRLYFTADDGVSGRELWRSDGTSGGTQLVADLNPGTESSNPVSFFVLANKLYFFALDVGTNGNAYKMYTTDGTTAGTRMIVAAIPREALYSGQGPCGATTVTLGGHAYLSLYELGFATSLWRTDGTAAGTVRFQDIASNIDDPCWLTVFKGRTYFSARQFFTVGNELFSAAPGEIPTLAVDLVPGNQGSSPAELTVFNDRLYFTAMTSAGWKVYSTDGVAAGATLLDVPVSFPNNLRVANGKLFFLQNSPVFPGGVPLFAGDGTTAGTARLGTVGVFGTLFSNGSRVFFSASMPGIPTANAQPWVSDGTPGGTFSLASPTFPEASQILYWDFNGATILQVHQPNGEARLWRSDGTVAGTKLLGDAGVVSQNHYPVKHQAAGQSFFFVSDKDGSGTELFAVDNEAPLAANDAAGSVQAGQALTINVATNDTDADGSVRASTVLVVTAPAHGTAVVSTTGVVTYTASAGYAGADSFTYSVADDQGARSAAATVNVTVTAPPAPPPPPPSGGGGGGGGGGTLGLVELLWLATILAMCGRRRRT